jgi:hypothetical protein
MKKILLTLAAGGVILATGFSSLFAQDEDDGAAPVELFTCSFSDGKGPADLTKVIAKWNKWADDRGMDNYSAWTLTPFFASTNQEFDVGWMGVAPTGAELGAALDDWLANGSELQAEFDAVAPCDSHAMFAALQFKNPPDRDDPSQVFVSFSDCTIGEGSSFDNDVAPAIAAWSEWRSGQGSTAGYWVFVPIYGGGGEEFDFKFVASYGSLEEFGTDFDNYDPDKASELFPSGMVDCDSARVYITRNVRMAASGEE